MDYNTEYDSDSSREGERSNGGSRKNKTRKIKHIIIKKQTRRK